MDYDSIDWEVEAKRVARAFGIEEQCQFVLDNDLVSRSLYVGDDPYFYLSSEAIVRVDYFDLGRSFQTMNPRQAKAVLFVSIDWDGFILMSQAEFKLSLLLSKPLFHLGLLSPEVEAALKLTITAHQKIEWARQYEERYGL